MGRKESEGSVGSTNEGGIMRADKSNNPDKYGNVNSTQRILLLFRTHCVQR